MLGEMGERGRPSWTNTTATSWSTWPSTSDRGPSRHGRRRSARPKPRARKRVGRAPRGRQAPARHCRARSRTGIPRSEDWRNRASCARKSTVGVLPKRFWKRRASSTFRRWVRGALRARQGQKDGRGFVRPPKRDEPQRGAAGTAWRCGVGKSGTAAGISAPYTTAEATRAQDARRLGASASPTQPDAGERRDPSGSPRARHRGCAVRAAPGRDSAGLEPPLPPRRELQRVGQEDG